MTDSDIVKMWKELPEPLRRDVEVYLADAEQAQLREAADYTRGAFPDCRDKDKAAVNARKQAEAFSVARRVLEHLR